MKRKFIGAGSSRKTYDIGRGRCIKTPIEERYFAGITQNRYEAMNLWKYGSNYSCFPKIYSQSNDFDEIEVENCPTVDNSVFEKYLSEAIDIKSVGLSPRIDGYRNIPLDGQYTRWIAFVFGNYFTWKVLEENGIDDFESFSKSSKQYFELYLRSNPYSQFASIIPEIWKFIEWLDNNDSNTKNSLRDLITFYIRHGKETNFLFADLWNTTQWGMRHDTGEFVVIDFGFSLDLSKSKHYSNGKIVPINEVKRTYPRSFPNMFNGERIVDIRSPGGANVSTKFYTKSEYILAEDGMSRHIKNLGLKDDGLWPWFDKMTFMNYSNLSKLMDTMNRNKYSAIKVNFRENSLSVDSIGKNGEWEEKLNIDDVSYSPKIGLHVCEFTFDGYNTDKNYGILKKYHPGHDVTWIEKKEEVMR